MFIYRGWGALSAADTEMHIESKIVVANALIDKSIAFASRIIKLHRYLIKDKKKTVISKQILRSGTGR